MRWVGSGCLVCTLLAQDAMRRNPLSKGQLVASCLAMGASLVACGADAFQQMMLTACDQHSQAVMNQLATTAGENPKLTREEQLRYLGCAVHVDHAKASDA